MTLFLRLLTLILLTIFASCRGTRSELNSFVSGTGGIKKLKVIPSRGSTVFTTEVTIIGSGFDTEGINVFVGDETCKNIEIVNDEQINCTISPQAQGKYDVLVSKDGDQSEKVENGFSFINPISPTGAAPILDSVTDSSGPATVTKSITLNGTNFVDGSVVSFDTNLGTFFCANVVVSSDKNSLTCNTPVLTPTEAASVSGASDVKVQTPDGQMDSLSAAFSFTGPPKYSSLGFSTSVLAAPVNGVLSNNNSTFTMTIIGENFQDNLSIQINDKAANDCAYVSSTQITCSSLPDQGGNTDGSYSLLISNPDEQSVLAAILLVGRPAITSITPTTSNPDGGTLITLNGENLSSINGLADSTILFRNLANNSNHGSCSVVSPTTAVTCTTPATSNPVGVIVRFQNSYGYIIDHSGFATADAAVMQVSFVENENYVNKIGKVAIGSVSTFTVRLSNLSSSTNITGITVDVSSIESNNFTYDAASSNCTNLATLSNCDLIFSYTAAEHEYLASSGDIVVNYDNGQNADSKTFNFGNVWTAPLKILYPERDFGDIPPETKCVLSIDFSPTSIADYSGILTLTYNRSNTKILNLTGKSTSATKDNCNPASSSTFGGGDGSVDNPFLICSKAHFEDLHTNTWADTDPWSYRNKSYLQTADLDLSNPTGGAQYNPNLNVGATPVAIFNGGGYQIKNYTSNYTGLWSGVFYYSGNFENIQIIDQNIVGGRYTGGITGGGSFVITNSYATGSITGGNNTAGLASWLNTGGYVSKIINSYNYHDIIGAYSSGGLTSHVTSGSSLNVERTYSLGSLTSSISSGNIYLGGISSSPDGTGTINISNVQLALDITNPGAYTGGFFPYNTTIKTINITDSSYSGDINTNGTSAGGVFGSLGSNTNVTISKVAVTGNISTISHDYIGGLCGNCSAGTISESYFSGKVYGRSHVGGIAGYAHTVNDSFTVGDINATGFAHSAAFTRHYYGTISASYVTSFPPTKQSHIVGTSGKGYEIFGTNPTATGLRSDIYYLEGVGIGMTASGVTSRTHEQISTSLPGLTDNTDKWKYGTASYPYPILKWMEDDFVP